MIPLTTDVLIIGAGPTGLALAIALRQAGIRHALVDKLPAGLGLSRAAVIHAHTLEQLDAIGVSEALLAAGLPLSKFALRDRDRALLSLSFDDLPTRFPLLLMLPQDVTERILTERLEALGGLVHRGWSAEDVTQTGDGVTARLVGPEGSREIAAKYVIGADGMHSRVRSSAGIAFNGAAYAESFVLADVRMDCPLADEVSLYFAPAGLVVVAPLPGGAFRVVATLDDAPENPSLAEIQRLLSERGPAAHSPRVHELIWSSRFRLHHRVADRYRDGRILIMGDAAHVHSPAGGQGMNTGLVDAMVLARLLAKVVPAGEPPEALDAYGALRRPAAVEVMAMAGRLTGMATTRSPLGRLARNAAFRTLDRIAPAKRKIEMNLSGLARRRYAEAA